MKKLILYIDKMEKGGAQRVMLNIANYYSELNKEVILINDYPLYDEPQYNVSDKIKRVYIDDYNRDGKIIKNFKRINYIRKIAKKESPDLILSFLGRPNVRMLLATFGMSTKKIISVRNDPKKEYGTGIKRIIANIIFKLADGYVFQTNEAREYFFSSIKKKSTVIPNPVSEVFNNTKYDAKLAHNIIAVGRLEEQKNHTLLIHAFNLIKNKIGNNNLYIYGKGTKEHELKELISSLKIEDRVFLPGSVENMTEIYSKAKVFVLSSDYEGMPNALMEAMAVGVPCISTNCPCGGPREIIVDNINGLLTPVNDVKALSDKIESLINDEEKSICISKNAKTASEKFKSSVIMKLWFNYFNEVINK